MSAETESAPPEPAASGAIHDIGYRHFDGERLGRANVIRVLTTESLRGAYGLGRTTRAKVAPILLLIAACVPALIIAMIAAVTRLDSLPVNYVDYTFQVQVLISIFVAVTAPAIVSRDLRFRISSLYFSRPMKRLDYVLARYLAATLALLVYIFAPLVVLFLGALLADMPLDRELSDLFPALVGGLMLSMLLAGLGVLIAALAPRRGMGVAAIVTVLLLLTGGQAILYSIAGELGNDTAQVYAAMLSPYTLVQGVLAGVFDAPVAALSEPDTAVQVGAFVGAAVAIVVGCIGLLLLRYRRVSVS